MLFSTLRNIFYPKSLYISDYYKYQRESATKEPKHAKDDQGFIRYATNIDIENWKVEMGELQSKIPPPLLFNSNMDCFRHLKQKIKGVSVPKLTLKVAFFL